jgi:adenylosuccinate synthase
MQRGKINVIIDGQWGSTGKGKLAGFLARRHPIAVAVCDFQSNAGHTWVGDDGRKIITHQLPSSAVNLDTTLAICAGSGITVSRLLQEIEELSDLNVAGRLVIDAHAHIIGPKHAEIEQITTRRIASTMKGCGAALADKVMRTAKLAQDVPELTRWIGDVSSLVRTALRGGSTVLAESAQGFDLSLNHGHCYPHTTSRDVTPASLLSNVGVPVQLMGDVYGSLRTYPIRVGHVTDGMTIAGHSGPHYNDQSEMTWEQLRVESGAMNDLTERTTVTNRVRRVFTFSPMQLRRFIEICGPSHLFVNFMNHVNAADFGIRDYDLLSKESMEWLRQVEGLSASMSHPGLPIQVALIGTGPRDSDMVIR